MRRTWSMAALSAVAALALVAAPATALAETRVVKDSYGNSWTVTDELDREGEAGTREDVFTIVVPDTDAWDIDDLSEDQLDAALLGVMPDSESAANYPAGALGTGTSTPLYRLYNPYTGEHVYTIDANEKDELSKVGWRVEGAHVEWMDEDPESIGSVCKMTKASPVYPPVYRLYNPFVPGGDHHYTTDVNEYEELQRLGWRGEGVIFSSAPMSLPPLYRLYNPNAQTGAHHYTNDRSERDALVEAGWTYEGIGWYARGFLEGVG